MPQNYTSGKSLRELAENDAKTYGFSLKNVLTPEEVNQITNTQKEEFRNFFQLKYKNRTAVVRTFNDNIFWPRESEWAAGINRLIASPPKIAFLADEIERGPFSARVRDYYVFANRLSDRFSLINQGYDFDTISLKHNAIPSDIAALVIADPRTPFTPGNWEKINNYINSGGNLFVATEPDRKEVISPLLKNLGLSLREGMLIQPSTKYSSDCVFAYITDTAKVNFASF